MKIKIMTGYLNVNTLTQTKSSITANHLMDYSDHFAISNLVNIKNCTKGVCSTSFEVMITNKPKGSYNTSAVTTGMIDCLKLILSF